MVVLVFFYIPYPAHKHIQTYIRGHRVAGWQIPESGTAAATSDAAAPPLKRGLLSLRGIAVTIAIVRNGVA